MPNRFFIHPRLYPFSSVIESPVKLKLCEDPDELTQYLPPDATKLIGYKINNRTIYYLSKNPNTLRIKPTSLDFYPIQKHNPLQLVYFQDPTQYTSLFRYTIQPGLVPKNINCPFIIAYHHHTKRRITTLYSSIPNDNSIPVSEVLQDNLNDIW